MLKLMPMNKTFIAIVDLKVIEVQFDIKVKKVKMLCIFRKLKKMNELSTKV